MLDWKKDFNKKEKDYFTHDEMQSFRKKLKKIKSTKQLFWLMDAISLEIDERRT